MTQLAAALKPRVQVILPAAAMRAWCHNQTPIQQVLNSCCAPCAKSTNRFVRWQDAAGASISTLAIYTYTVPNAASTLTAVFN